MPKFTPEDMEIDAEEYIDACNDKQIKELVNFLMENDYISTNQLHNRGKMSLNELNFESYLDALHGKRNMMSREEEEIIMIIAKKYKLE